MAVVARRHPVWARTEKVQLAMAAAGLTVARITVHRRLVVICRDPMQCTRVTTSAALEMSCEETDRIQPGYEKRERVDGDNGKGNGCRVKETRIVHPR
jgi:hypothetical protein